MYKILGIAALVIIIAFGLTVNWYGDSRYDAGVLSCKADAATAAITAGNESAKQLDKVMNETAHMSDADVDDDLRKLGIMRPDAVR